MVTNFDKIEEIENEIARTQKNKATERHLGMLKAKLASLRAESLVESKKKTGEGFAVSKSGYLRIGLLGFPSVGKSTLLNKFTSTVSKTAGYEFTTVTAIPGIMKIFNTKFQLLDLPGIVEGAKDNIGRGRRIIDMARSCDLILIVLDCTKPIIHKKLIERELEALGIRLNKKMPNISVEPNKDGHISIMNKVQDLNIDIDLIKSIFASMKIGNVHITIREKVTIDDIIDVAIGNRKYIPSIVVLNKIDAINIKELEIVAKVKNSVPVSCYKEWNLDELKLAIWDKLNIIRVYTKHDRFDPDFNSPMVLRCDRRSVEELCRKIHKDFLEKFKHAFVWGTSVKFQPQQVGINHELEDGDVVHIIKSV